MTSADSLAHQIYQTHATYQPSLAPPDSKRELRPGKPAKAVAPKPRSGEGGPIYQN